MIIYLDQNKWIELARAEHGKDNSTTLVETLAFLREGVSSGKLTVPLSAMHYIELAGVRNAGRRQRLGTFMYELSRGATLASYANILTFEIEAALYRRFPQVRPRPFALIGHGASHAFGTAVRSPFCIPAAIRSRLSAERTVLLEATLNASIELALLTGVAPNGMVMPPIPRSEHAAIFRNHLATLPQARMSLPAAKYDDLLTAVVMADMGGLLTEILTYHRLPQSALYDRGVSDLRTFVDELPSRRVDKHLHRQVLRNPANVAKSTDLGDWGALGPAVAHCDVLVCEKHFADLVCRDHFRAKARILTDVRALLLALAS